MNILIVDDAPEIRAYLSAMLSTLGWCVSEAADGGSACSLIEETNFEVVITDWMMPGMNGIDLIDWIRARKAGHYVYSILLTSRNEEADLVMGLKSGADDFISKPIRPAILHARLEVAKRILKIQQDLYAQQVMLRESRDLVAAAHANVQSDIEQAAHVQRSLLPQSSKNIKALSTAWRFRPAMGISGDNLDIFQVGENLLAFYLLDVSGHGVAAALRSAAIGQLLRPVSGLISEIESTGPGQVLNLLNRLLCRENDDVDYLATIVLGVIETTTGSLQLASAGHPPALLVKNGTVNSALDEGGLPLGIEEQASYPTCEIILEQNSILLMHSDGLLDCVDSDGQHFGYAALQNCLEDHSGLGIDELVAKVENKMDAWRGDTPLQDDVSLLAVNFKTPATEKSDPYNTHNLEDH